MVHAGRGGAGHDKGLLIRTAKTYDLQMWLFASGRERALREAMLRPAELRVGEAVLDVGCGTGSLAVLAARQVGPTGTVCGVDASEEMVDRAARKAQRAGVRANFVVGAAQDIPFEDGSFDVVLSTIMVHHLPRAGRERLAAETRRVLRDDGRALIVDFGEKQGHDGAGPLAKLHKGRHGHTKAHDMVELVKAAGLEVSRTGQIGKRVSTTFWQRKRNPEGASTLDDEETRAPSVPVRRMRPSGRRLPRLNRSPRGFRLAQASYSHWWWACSLDPQALCSRQSLC